MYEQVTVLFVCLVLCELAGCYESQPVRSTGSEVLELKQGYLLDMRMRKEVIE